MMNHVVAHINGWGSYLPARRVDNDYFSASLDTSDEWIRSRTGILERRFAAAEEYPSDMGAKASLAALERAGFSIDQVDLILVATMSGDYLTPSTAVLLQQQLGSSAPAMDLQAACSGFLYALCTAKAFVESQLYECILVVATEKMSALLDFEDRTTCVLFGDGAAAVLVSAQPKGLKLQQHHLGADGRGAELVMIPGGGSRHPFSMEQLEPKMHHFKMQGRELFKQAVRASEASARLCLASAALEPSALRWLVPHQNNRRMMDAIAKAIGLPNEKVASVVERYGNTSSAGVAIALAELCDQDQVAMGDRLLLSVCGGGLTWGSLLLECASELHHPF